LSSKLANTFVEFLICGVIADNNGILFSLPEGADVADFCIYGEDLAWDCLCDHPNNSEIVVCDPSPQVECHSIVVTVGSELVFQLFQVQAENKGIVGQAGAISERLKVLYCL
jgi:hypothetical protein